MVIQQIGFRGSPLRDKFPEGHSIKVDAPFVYLVGGNGSGKTCLLRLLYSALSKRDDSLSLVTVDNSHLHVMGFSPIAGYVPKGVRFKGPLRGRVGSEDHFEFVHPEVRGCGDSSGESLGIGARAYSEGMKLMGKLDSVFERIRFYFEEQEKFDYFRRIHEEDERNKKEKGLGTHPKFSIVSLEESIEEMAFFNLVERSDYIPPEEREDPRLVVLIDEPTVFLSYRNKYQFRDRILDEVGKYAGKLQFFIATNDPVLIERTSSPLFIDLDQKPVVSTDRYDPLA